MKKTTLFILMSSVLFAEFPTYDEVFNGKKKEKIKIIYVQQNGPQLHNGYSSPLANEGNIEKKVKKKPARVSTVLQKPRNTGRGMGRGVSDVHSQIGQLEGGLTGKKGIEKEVNTLNPIELGEKIETTRLDAVDRLHKMAKCEEKAETKKDKERCWQVKSNNSDKVVNSVGPELSRKEMEEITLKYGKQLKL